MSLHSIETAAVNRNVRGANRTEAEGYSRLASQPQIKTNFFLGKLDSTLSHHGTVTVSIYRWSGTVWEDTGEDITAVRDAFENTGETLVSGTLVKVEWYLNQWVITQAACEAADW